MIFISRQLQVVVNTGGKLCQFDQRLLRNYYFQRFRFARLAVDRARGQRQSVSVRGDHLQFTLREKKKSAVERVPRFLLGNGEGSSIDEGVHYRRGNNDSSLL